MTIKIYEIADKDNFTTILTYVINCHISWDRQIVDSHIPIIAETFVFTLALSGCPRLLRWLVC